MILKKILIDCDFSTISPNIGVNETKILDFIEKNLGYKILRQHVCNGYFIDGYCKELNLAIEVDEEYHKTQIEKDLSRQKVLEKVLKCDFVRIED